MQGGNMKSVVYRKILNIIEKTIRCIENWFEIVDFYTNLGITFPDSKITATKRLICMERKMAQYKEFRNQYCHKVERCIRKRYTRKLAESDTTLSTKDWYIPLFANGYKNRIPDVYDIDIIIISAICPIL